MTDTLADELGRLVDTTARHLQTLDPAHVTVRPAPEKWSIQELLGHLLDSAVNNHHRFVRAQAVDELVFPKYEQDEWVAAQHYAERDWPTLIELWRLYNHHLAHVIRNLPQDKLDVTCRIGPYDPVTLGFLVEDYLVHLKHHLNQITALQS